MTPSSSRRKAPIGVSRSAVRVARRRIVSAVPARRLLSPRLSGSVMRRSFGVDGSVGTRKSENDQFVRRDERSLLLPRCHPRSAVCRTLTDGPLVGPLPGCRSIGAALYRWRSAPEPTGRPRRPRASASWPPPRVRSGGSRVHSPPPPPRLAPTAGSLEWRSTGTRPDRCPCSVVTREYRSGRQGVKRGVRRWRDAGVCSAGALARARMGGPGTMSRTAVRDSSGGAARPRRRADGPRADAGCGNTTILGR